MQIQETLRSKQIGYQSVVSPILEWVDLELHDSHGIPVSSKDDDLLLELRGLLSSFCKNPSGNKLIGGFYRLLPALNKNHYLLGYRLRQWISLNFSVHLSDPLQRVAAQTLQIKQSSNSIDHFKLDYLKNANDYISTSDVRVQILVGFLD